MAHADNNSLFIDTNLDTRFVIIVSHSDTISDLKRKIMLEHQECFPAIGDIKIDSMKVERSGRFYHLPDSMLVKSVFATVKDDWFLSVDASRLAQGVGMQQVDNYKIRDQLALPCATYNRSVDEGSPPSTHHEINSNKRTLVQTESLVEDASGVEKKRKIEEKGAIVKFSEDLGGDNIITSNENSLENNIQEMNDESTGLNKGEKCSGMDQEATIVSSSIESAVAETHVQKNTEASEIILPNVFMVLEKNIPSEVSQNEKGESLLVQNNSEASETVPAGVQENIQQVSHKEKENELVKDRVPGNEILSSSMRTSDCELDDSEKDKTAEKEVLSTSLIKTRHTLLKDGADMSEKDLGSTIQESAGDEIDNRKEGKKSSRKQESEVKLPRRKKKAKKSAARNKDESAKSIDELEKSKDESVKNKDELEKSKDDTARNKDESARNKDEAVVSEIPSIVPATAHETEKDNVNLSNAEKNEGLEKTLPDDVTMQEVEISKPTDVVVDSSKEIKDAVGRRKKKKDVTVNDDAATVTNEENISPHSGRREESQDTPLIDAFLVDDSITDNILANNDVEVPRTEKNINQGNDDGIDEGEKRKKKKKKTKKSAKNGEGGMPTEISDPNHLNENEKNKKSLVKGPADLPSKCQSTEVELEPEKSQSTSMTVSEAVASKDVVNEEGNVSKEGSQDIDFLDHFTPGKDTTMNTKVKEPKKKTKEQFFVNFRNDSAIQPQKLISKSKSKRVPTNVVNDPRIPNTDQLKSPKKKSKMDAPRISNSAHADKAHGEPSSTEVFVNQKGDRPRVILGLANVKSVQKNAPEVNMSQHAKTLLSLSGTIFRGDSEDGCADDNASPRKSSSQGDTASSIDSGSCAVKRKGVGDSQSKSKKLSMSEHVRSSPRFKKAKVTASQQLQRGDTESEPALEFVPERQSPPMYG